MNNSTVHPADWLTDLTIVVLSLAMVSVVVGIGIAARDMSTQLAARASALQAGQPTIGSGSDTSTIR